MKKNKLFQFVMAISVTVLSLVATEELAFAREDVRFDCSGEGHRLKINSGEDRIEIKGKSTKNQVFDLNAEDIRVSAWSSGEVSLMALGSGPESWEDPSRGARSDCMILVEFDKVTDRYNAKIHLASLEGGHQLLPYLTMACSRN
jgi:hypothetical protein